MPLGLIFSPGKYPSTEAGYTDTFAQLRKWVLARLDWMNGQLTAVAAVRPKYSNKRFRVYVFVTNGRLGRELNGQVVGQFTAPVSSVVKMKWLRGILWLGASHIIACADMSWYLL